MTVIQRFIKYLEELLWHFRDLICSGIVLPSVICISAKWEHQERKLLQLISQQFNISLWQKWKTFKFSIDCCSDSYNNVHSLKHHQLLFFFSSFKHIQMMNKSQLRHGNVSIDPTGTFTPDSLFTVRKKKRLPWLNWQINQELKVTFCFSGPLHWSIHLSHLFSV